MNRREAIRILKEERTSDLKTQAISQAIEDIRIRIPIKIMPVKFEHGDFYYLCPNCRYEVGEDCYCSNCGQALTRR